MKKVCLAHHGGLGDHIECNGMVRHYAERYDEVVIFSKEPYLPIVKFLYRDCSKIKIQCVPTGTSAELMAIWDYLDSFEGDVVVAGFFNYNKNLRFFEQQGFGPAQSFYYLANVPFKYRKEKFYIKRDLEKEKETLESLNPTNEDFIFVHDDPSRGFEISITKDIKIIRNDPTRDFFSMLGVLTKAKEIHCMSSSYFCLIDCMDETLFTDAKYLHTSVRGVELGEQGISGNWKNV